MNYDFNTVAELIAMCAEHGVPVHEIMLRRETQNSLKTRDEIIETMLDSLKVMRRAVQCGMEGVSSVTGLTGNDALRLKNYIDSDKAISGGIVLRAACRAIAVNELNASMGTICACPTAGSCGVMPGVMFSLEEKLGLSEEDLVNFLFSAGAFGLIIANNASISGAAGGCQAEIGSAGAMAAAAAVLTAGGTPEQAGHACAIALKNLMGLVCDPVAGLVEIPCVKRNAIGAANAVISCDMALAGIESRIPCDEVISAMFEVGKELPISLRETAMGGLAKTPTALEIESRIMK